METGVRGQDAGCRPPVRPHRRRGGGGNSPHTTPSGRFLNTHFQGRQKQPGRFVEVENV